MNDSAPQLNADQLGTLVPLSILSQSQLDQLLHEARVHSVGAGTTIFKQGQRDNQTIYVLSGELSLITDGKLSQTICAGTEQARYAIANLQPRRFTAKTNVATKVLSFDSKLLDHHLTMHQTQSIEVADIGGDDSDEDDWMTRMLQSQLFVQIPPANIQQMLMRMEQVNVHRGDRVINEGDDGDFYYIIKRGRCAVLRNGPEGTEPTKLAELGEGASFGEEALVSDKKRNASIEMVSDGVLMRLGKSDFVELVKKPLSHQVKYTDAQKLIESGAIWLDVRSEAEFQADHLPDSTNVPLPRLRAESKELDPDAVYVAYCDTGSRGSVASFLLGERGIETHFLEGGLGALPEGVELITNTEALAQPDPAPVTGASTNEQAATRDSAPATTRPAATNTATKIWSLTSRNCNNSCWALKKRFCACVKRTQISNSSWTKNPPPVISRKSVKLTPPSNWYEIITLG